MVSGFYRYVRNPMFVGTGLAILGETALFGSVRAGLGYLVALGAALAVFVIAYEEPALRAKFGAEYEEYCRHVPRFIPRLRPWKGDS